MAVYVDDAKHPFGRMVMSHMIADSLDELNSMANRIGISQRYLQGNHYDICQSKRELAIAHGAIQVTPREIARIRKQLRVFLDGEESK